VISAAGGPVGSVAEVAAAFELNAEAATYHEADKELATAILVEILHRDLSQGNRVMRLSRAEELATEFMQRYGKTPCRFFTNGKFAQDAGAGLVLKEWNPATSSTFDTGILVVGATESACIWVAEDD
jgi:hypothetical protein